MTSVNYDFHVLIILNIVRGRTEARLYVLVVLCV
jgi:hypothetical protein